MSRCWRGGLLRVRRKLDGSGKIMEQRGLSWVRRNVDGFKDTDGAVDEYRHGVVAMALIVS